MKQRERRSGFAVMAGLIGMVRPLLAIMLLAILMGCAGNLAATFLTILGGYGLLEVTGFYNGMPLAVIFTLLIVFAVARGILRYAEQACNHYIAFKLLAHIRHQVFAALRRLAPAKLDGSKKGNLISVITSDIELLEVFYAHTISPIVIAAITSVFMIVFIGKQHIALGVFAGFCYFLVGVVIPLLNGKWGSEGGWRYRDSFGRLNTIVLDNLYGLEEILQYGQEEKRLAAMEDCTAELESVNGELKRKENVAGCVTNGVILAAGIGMAAISGLHVLDGRLSAYQAVIATIALMSSFGPVAALSALSNNLHLTLASGNRVLAILEEQPLVEDVTDGTAVCGDDICCENVSFSYVKENADSTEDTAVLKNFDAFFTPNRIHGILGKSGCGKSTLLKLLMRFYEPDAGKVAYSGTDVNCINTSALRNQVSYVTQETFLFQDTIENNIRVARADATHEEVVEAAKKASVHEFICSLPKGYDTKLAELGDSLSGGEKQRIGIARAFLHGGRVIFLDEPTSNIDSLNEGIILEALRRERENRTILLVSHRKSTMGIVEEKRNFA